MTWSCLEDLYLVLASARWLRCLGGGYVIVLLWRWFVMPQFHLAALPWTVAYGLVLLCHLLVPIPETKHEDKSYMASMVSLAVSGVLAPWLICGMAWVIK